MLQEYLYRWSQDEYVPTQIVPHDIIHDQVNTRQLPNNITSNHTLTMLQNWHLQTNNLSLYTLLRTTYTLPRTNRLNTIWIQAHIHVHKSHTTANKYVQVP